VAEGDPFNPREIREAAERIRALGYFTDVDVDTRQGSAGDRVIVDVDLEEGTTGSLGFGVSYGRDTGAGFAITFTETNWLGRGQRLDMSLNTGTSSQDTSIFFEEPAFLGRDVALGLGVFYRTTDNLGALYDTRRVGATFSLGFPVSEFGRFDVRYGISKDSLRNVGVNSSPLIQADTGKGPITSAFGVTYAVDTRRSLVNPNFGYLFRVNADLAGFGGDRRYFKTTALGSVEQRLMNQDITVRAEVEAGALFMQRGNSRVTERFMLNEEMRGFTFNGLGPRDLNAVNQDALGGNYFAVARVEADFPLGLPEEYGISGGVFMDIGSTWGLNDKVGAGGVIVDDSRRWRASAGVSVFWDTPIGPLRFNFSRALRKESYDKPQNFDLSISSRF